eukprot:5476167-Pyramimonas_sp.AAC.1
MEPNSPRLLLPLSESVKACVYHAGRRWGLGGVATEKKDTREEDVIDNKLSKACVGRSNNVDVENSRCSNRLYISRLDEGRPARSL